MATRDIFVEIEITEIHLVSDKPAHVEPDQVAGSWYLFDKLAEKWRVVKTVEHKVHPCSYRY